MTRHEAYRECIENTVRLFYNSSLAEGVPSVENRKLMRQKAESLAFAVKALLMPHFFLRDVSEEWTKDFEKARQELFSEYQLALDYFA